MGKALASSRGLQRVGVPASRGASWRFELAADPARRVRRAPASWRLPHLLAGELHQVAGAQQLDRLPRQRGWHAAGEELALDLAGGALEGGEGEPARRGSAAGPGSAGCAAPASKARRQPRRARRQLRERRPGGRRRGRPRRLAPAAEQGHGGGKAGRGEDRDRPPEALAQGQGAERRGRLRLRVFLALAGSPSGPPGRARRASDAWTVPVFSGTATTAGGSGTWPVRNAASISRCC